MFAAAAAAAAAEKPWLILSISVNIDWLCGSGWCWWRMESGERGIHMGENGEKKQEKTGKNVGFD